MIGYSNYPGSVNTDRFGEKQKPVRVLIPDRLLSI